MNKRATENLIRILDEIDSIIKDLESNPHRAFILMENSTISLFHEFNMSFKFYWKILDRNSASQLFKYMEISKRFSEMCDSYENMLVEQFDYFRGMIDYYNKSVDRLPLVIFSEERKNDYIGYYQEYIGDNYGGSLDTLYQISATTREAFSKKYERLSQHTNYYELRCDILFDMHYNALANTFQCLETLLTIMSSVKLYPQVIACYTPIQEDIIIALETDFRQFVIEKEMIVERDLQKTAQVLKPVRNAQLTPDVWGKVMEEEDDLYRLAISGQLGENKEKRFENIFDEQRKQLTYNASLLQTIKNTAVDGELFDIRLSVESQDLLSSLNADNLDMFYELVLRRNIIQREMFPDKLKDVYEEWLNGYKEQEDPEGNDAEENACSTESPNDLNYYAPTINLQTLLKQDWFKEVRTNEMYNSKWTDKFVNDLMATQWGNGIAQDWAVTGEREKKNQIKGYILGLLKDTEVIDGSYDSIAAKVGIMEDSRSFSNYMSQGKKQPYSDWVKRYVTGLMKE